MAYTGNNLPFFDTFGDALHNYVGSDLVSIASIQMQYKTFIEILQWFVIIKMKMITLTVNDAMDSNANSRTSSIYPLTSFQHESSSYLSGPSKQFGNQQASLYIDLGLL